MSPAPLGRAAARGRPLLVLAILAAALTVGAGCEQLAWCLNRAIVLWVPEEESAAEYSFKGKSVLVLVDSQDAALTSEFPRLEAGITDRIVKTLAERKAAGPLVPAQSVDAARRTQPGFEKWSVAEAGKFFNVDLVLHIRLTTFRLKDTSGSTVFHGYGESVVQVVAMENGQKVWPSLASARIIRVESVQGTEPEEAGEMEQMMVEGLADKIARHFYTYKKEELPLKPKVQ